MDYAAVVVGKFEFRLCIFDPTLSCFVFAEGFVIALDDGFEFVAHLRAPLFDEVNIVGAW
jgi:hypothetical protein